MIGIIAEPPELEKSNRLRNQLLDEQRPEGDSQDAANGLQHVSPKLKDLLADPLHALDPQADEGDNKLHVRDPVPIVLREVDLI